MLDDILARGISREPNTENAELFLEEVYLCQTNNKEEELLQKAVILSLEAALIKKELMDAIEEMEGQ